MDGRKAPMLPVRKVGRFEPPSGYRDEERLSPILQWLDEVERWCGGPQLYRVTASQPDTNARTLCYSGSVRDRVLAHPEASELVIEWLGNA